MEQGNEIFQLLLSSGPVGIIAFFLWKLRQEDRADRKAREDLDREFQKDRNETDKSIAAAMVGLTMKIEELTK